jgi:Fe-S oxidoreductase
MTSPALKKHLSSCSRCNYCRSLPVPKSDEFAFICPSIQYGKRFGYTGGGKMIIGYGLAESQFEYSPEVIDTIYSCSMCGACDVACKTNTSDLIEPLDALYEVRKLCVDNGHVPQAMQALLTNLRMHGNVNGQPSADRENWVQDLAVGRASDRNADAILLHIGDAAFDSAQWEGLHYAVSRLLEAGETVAIGGSAEPDCGGLAFDIGDHSLARSLAEQTRDFFRNSGASRVVTCSDAAFMAFRAIYPRLGVNLDGVEIVHITQWLAQQEARSLAKSGEVVTYHDACRLGRLSEKVVPWEGEWSTELNTLPVRVPEAVVRFGSDGIYEEPRTLLATAGARVVEMERNREFSYCCGAGGGGAQANPDFASMAGLERLKEATATGATTMVTSCGGCTHHMNSLATQAGLPIRVVSLLDYLRQTQEGVHG